MMKAYPKYKDSGEPWLGEIPAHWHVRRLGSLFLERKQKVRDTDFAPLSVTKKGILPQLDSAAKSNNRDNRKKVCKGDFVINSRSDRKGSSGISPQNGSVSFVNTVLIPISLHRRYVHNFFRSQSFQKEFYRVGRGIVGDLWSTTYADMRIIMIPVPTQAEQQQIARYLDWKTTIINKIVKAKKKLIALLKQGKQNIINEAMTKGLNPNVPMKDSGVQWLGEIPAHWEVRKLKYCICGKLKYGANASGTDYSPEFPRYIRITDFNSGGYLNEKNKLSLNISRFEDYLLEDGDLLFARSGATVGKVFQCKKLAEPSCFAGYLIKAKPKLNIITSGFLYLYTQSLVFDKWKTSTFNKATIENIGADKYSQLLVVVPSIKEQKTIFDYIENRTLLIDKSIACIEREIELCREYHTRLVSDVVTGKIDVRPFQIPDFEPVENELVALDNDKFKDKLIAEDSEE